MDVGGIPYTWDANGNMLNDGANSYTYDTANRLTAITGGQSAVYAYRCNGLSRDQWGVTGCESDRVSQTVNGMTINYVLDQAAGLTQVLEDGTYSYTYGIGRISQQNESAAEYFLEDALGSVRQLTDQSGVVTLTKSYQPYGEVLGSVGSGISNYGFTGEMTDSTGLIYLRARYYAPAYGRFLTRDTWAGDYNRPLSLNRWNYVEANPINLVDPSGHSPEITSQILHQALSQHSGSSSILAFITNCSPTIEKEHLQYDLTGYLAVAMTKHGQDSRVKIISHTLVLADLYQSTNDLARTAIWGTAYLAFNSLVGGGKEWDIKLKIREELRDAIVLCGTGVNCRWVDYSTPGNIHFGYVAGLAKIDHFVAAIMGGLLEQKDLYDQNLPLEPLYCFQNGFPGLCDNPADQAAVDFGYKLAVKYGSGLTDQQLRQAINANGMGRFQKPPSGFPIPHPPYPQLNLYGADHFNQ